MQLCFSSVHIDWFSHKFICQCYHNGGNDFNYNWNQNTIERPNTTKQYLNPALNERWWHANLWAIHKGATKMNESKLISTEKKWHSISAEKFCISLAMRRETHHHHQTITTVAVATTDASAVRYIRRIREYELKQSPNTQRTAHMSCFVSFWHIPSHFPFPWNVRFALFPFSKKLLIWIISR